MLKKVSVFLCAILAMAFVFSIQALAAATPAPDAEDITVTNNPAGTPDTVAVSGLDAADIIRVYSTATGSTPIGAGPGTAPVYINQLGPGSGKVYVSVTASGSEESARTLETYTGEPQTTSPPAANITVTNNAAGKLDIITVSGVLNGDIIRIYQKSVGAAVLATAVSGDTTATLYVHQLGVSSGSVYVTVQHSGEVESDRVRASYTSETTPAISGTVIVVNRFYEETGETQVTGTEDTVTVPGVEAGDTITVYIGPTGPANWVTKELDAADITDGAGTVNIPQLGEGAGKVYVTITKDNKAESSRKTVPFSAEPTTTVPASVSVSITNAYGSSDDTVTVNGLPGGIKVNLYSSTDTFIDDETETGSGTVSFTLASDVLNAGGGKLYLSFQVSGNFRESVQKAYSYKAEAKAPKLPAGNITVNNKSGGTQDEVVIEVTDPNLIGDVKIYNAAAQEIGSGTISAISMPVPIIIDAPGLTQTGGKLYVTLTTATAGESFKTMKTYSAEPTSTAPSAGNITVDNNVGVAPDTVIVEGLDIDDVVTVYSVKPLAEIGKSGPAAGSSVTVTLNAHGLSKTGGTIYVTVTSLGVGESPKTLKEYRPEDAATAPLLSSVTVFNNFETADEVEVRGLTTGDTVNVYSASKDGTLLGSVTAGVDSTVRFTLTGALEPRGSKVYVAISKSGINESPRTSVPYTSEITATPTAKTVTVVNNYYTEENGSPVPASFDTISVSGVQDGDKISVYRTSSDTEPWAVLNVTSANLVNGAATVTIDQLGSAGGKISVTVTALKKAESNRATIKVPSEKVTPQLKAANIKVDNNHSQDDTVTVTGLTAGQIVSVYLTQASTPATASEPAAGSSLTITIPDGELQQGGGRIYVTVKNTNELESKRTAQSYLSDVTVAPKVGNILVINNPGGGDDTVTLVGLRPNDIVTIYDAAIDGNILVSASVTGKGTTITLDTKLTDTAGKIYVTVTNEGKDESKRIAVSYYAA